MIISPHVQEFFEANRTQTAFFKTEDIDEIPTICNLREQGKFLETWY